MTNEMLAINTENIIVVPGSIEFIEFDKLRDQAAALAEQVKTVDVSDENIQYSKKLIAAINKKVKEMEDRRIAIKKEILEPYSQFESQVKEIVAIVKDADNAVRDQIRELEESERALKYSKISELFEKRIKQYSFGDVFTFENFIKPSHLNKSTNMKTVESEMVTWLEKIQTDLNVIYSLPNGTEILADYYELKDLSAAIQKANDRAAIKARMNQAIEKEFVSAPKSIKYIYTLTDEKDAKMLELFMQQNKIKFEKVEN